MMKAKIFGWLVLPCVAALLLADVSNAATLRYRQSGDWTEISSDGSSDPGWSTNSTGTPSGALPGAADDARINFGGNTVSVTSVVPAVKRVQIGVDESGTVEVNNGGVLTASIAQGEGDILAGNNNANATGTLIVNDGGEVNVGRIFWAAQNSSNGVITINSGGTVNVASHLWWGVTGTATVDISGTLNQTGGILGLGTSNASTPSGGSATVNILDGGLLAINNISSAEGLPSIQPNSFLNISGSGQLTLPGDFVGVLTDYANANKIGGNGVPGLANLTIDLTKNPGFTTAYIVPEPTSLLLLGLAVATAAFVHRR